MTSLLAWITVGLMAAVLLYAIFSMFLRKPLGLYMAAAFHVVLGVLALSSIGLYVFGLALIEIVIGISMTVKHRQTQT